TAVAEAEVDKALASLRDRAARYEPVDGRGIEQGDSVVMDLTRTAVVKKEEAEPLIIIPGQPRPEPEEQTSRHDGVTVDIGASANPPGFDQELVGLSAGEEKSFDVVYPADYAIEELAGTTVTYDVSIKTIRKRVMPDLDDEFAKDMGEFDSL